MALKPSSPDYNAKSKWATKKEFLLYSSLSLCQMKCPRCKHTIPIKKCLLLSNNSVINCKHCNTRLRAEKMSSAYFVIPFLLVGPISFFIALKSNSLLEGLLFGSVIGLIIYIIGIVYTYLYVKLFER